MPDSGKKPAPFMHRVVTALQDNFGLIWLSILTACQVFLVVELNSLGDTISERLTIRPYDVLERVDQLIAIQKDQLGGGNDE